MKVKSLGGTIKGFVAWILVGLFVLAFAFVGVPALDNFGAKPALKVGDTAYTTTDVEREFTRSIERERLENNIIYTPEEARQAGLLNQALSVLTLRGVYKEEADKLGLTVTDEMLQAYLQNNENLRMPGSDKFDQQALQMILQQNRMSLNQFREAIRTEMLQNQIDDVVGVGIPAPEVYGKTVALRQTEERVVRLATIAAADLDEPTDEELRSYYAAHADSYRTPERRQYTAVLLTPDDLSDRITVTDDEVRRLYNSRQASMNTPETRTFVQAQFPSMAAANAALENIRGGMTFQEAAQSAGIATAQFENEVKTNLVDEAVADAVYGTAEPGLVGPIDGDFGVVIAEVRNIQEGTEVAFDDVKDSLREELIQEVYVAEVDNIYDELQESGDSGASLAEAANDMGLPVRTVGPVDADFLTAEGAIEDGIPLAVQRQAFQMTTDELFAEVDLSDGGYGFVEVDEIIPGTVKSYEEVEAEVKAGYFADARSENLRNAAAALRSAIAGGESFEIAAVQNGATAETVTVSNTELPPQISEALFIEIFDAPIGDVVEAISQDGQSIMLAQTDSIRFGANGQWSTLSDRISAQLGQTISRDHYQAFLTAMQEAHGIERNDAAIAARFGAGDQ